MLDHQIVSEPPPPNAPTDERGGGGECWRCGGCGWARDCVSEPEVRHWHRQMGIPMPQGKFVFASASGPCQECPEGWRIARMLKKKDNE